MASFPVLLVDDDDLSLELVALQLSAIGHSAWKADTGSKALEMLSDGLARQAEVPDVVITDLQMPDMDGATLCSRIRGLGVYRPRILAMSATRPAAGGLAGFDGFLLKPLDLEALQAALFPAQADAPSARKASQKVAVSTVVHLADPPLDATILQKLRVLMPPAAVNEMLSAYVADTRTRLVQMERFADSGDQRSLRSSAHMIKGAAGMAGAVRISRIAAQLECGEIPTEHQKVLIGELRCACDAIEGTLAREDRVRDDRSKEAHDQPNSRIG